MARYTLLDDADTSGAAVNALPGRYSFYVYGTFDGATVNLQSRERGTSTWINEPGGTYTGAGQCDVKVASANLEFRCEITSAGGSTEITATLV